MLFLLCQKVCCFVYNLYVWSRRRHKIHLFACIWMQKGETKKNLILTRNQVINHGPESCNSHILPADSRQYEHWKSHSTLTLLATQNYPFLLKYDCPLWLK